MNFGSPGFYVSSYLDEDGSPIEHFVGSNFYIRWEVIGGPASMSFGRSDRTSRVAHATRARPRPALSLRHGLISIWSRVGTSIVRDEDLLNGRIPILGGQLITTADLKPARINFRHRRWIFLARLV